MDVEIEGDYVLYDASNSLTGRIASRIAKDLMNGNKVVVVNSEKALISGSKKSLVEKYKTRLNLQEKSNPEHSPYWPRRPDLLFKRIVRGMLPHNKPRGKEAYKKLRVFMGVPNEFKNAKPKSIEIKNAKDMYVHSITIEELSKLLGYKG
ncbi:MAG: 50S ribosomal protein L13 [Candidatus Micrarchaeaceae archaeon]